MNLTRYTDYSLRVLIYVGLHPERRVSIHEISEAFAVSQNHLVKVVHHLGKCGFLKTTRGRTGGLMLGQDPAAIRVGDVVRQTEPGFELLECFAPATDHCAITQACRLKGVLAVALREFLAVLDRTTLADLLQNETSLRRLVAPKR